MIQTNTDNKTEERKNRFSGESYMLTKEEADRHDCIFLAEHMAEVHTDPDTKDKYAFGYDDWVSGPAILIKQKALKNWA